MAGEAGGRRAASRGEGDPGGVRPAPSGPDGPAHVREPRPGRTARAGADGPGTSVARDAARARTITAPGRRRGTPGGVAAAPGGPGGA
jgi:hypothetical protein